MQGSLCVSQIFKACFESFQSSKKQIKTASCLMFMGHNHIQVMERSRGLTWLPPSVIFCNHVNPIEEVLPEFLEVVWLRKPARYPGYNNLLHPGNKRATVGGERRRVRDWVRCRVEKIPVSRYLEAGVDIKGCPIAWGKWTKQVEHALRLPQLGRLILFIYLSETTKISSSL